MNKNDFQNQGIRNRASEARSVAESWIIMSQAKQELEPFEQKRADVDFQNVWNQITDTGFPDLRSGYEFAYMAGRVAGKNDAIHKLIKAAESLKETA